MDKGWMAIVCVLLAASCAAPDAAEASVNGSQFAGPVVSCETTGLVASGLGPTLADSVKTTVTTRYAVHEAGNLPAGWAVTVQVNGEDRPALLAVVDGHGDALEIAVSFPPGLDELDPEDVLTVAIDGAEPHRCVVTTDGVTQGEQSR
jgi:hypothetical protein